MWSIDSIINYVYNTVYKALNVVTVPAADFDTGQAKIAVTGTAVRLNNIVAAREVTIIANKENAANNDMYFHIIHLP